ncbi:MAG: hypothetical protein A2Y48_10505 [Nitrospirae bacterium RIFCSPLOW2_12_42_9]|nr:MAG: hypothetical protein A2Z60_00375 [Nitrospirae bacterium RIFCSPLOWO2_02_42_7]OGW59249.1 MAG: hypothetical protein A3D21_03265 [Nitrospirae bacterium RIFCSPHIGHO2_02_FULL_42_12]OGW62199.1 MAG: hypothetical protein A2Y48_10505 [Nitrospirae bacterium RIFCSPLOW2_12_42_9]
MEKLRKAFENSFGIPIPEIMLPKEKLSSWDNALLFGSSVAKSCKELYLIQGNITKFIESCPEDYFLIGFWGHGVNSYALYYLRVDSWSKIFFRLPYGGVYEDNEKNARHIREFLINFFAFEKELVGKVKSLIAVESMGEGSYKVVTFDGKEISFKGTLLYSSSMLKEKFACLFRK